MTVTLKLVFLILALVCFALAFANVPKFNWQAGGFFFTLLYVAA